MDSALFKKIWPVFVEEAREHLEELSSGVLEMERDPQSRPEGLLESMRRTAHSLKGSSASLGIHDIEKLAHALEDGLVGRQSSDRLGSSMVEAMLAALAAMEGALDRGDEGADPSVDGLPSLMANLASFSVRSSGVPAGAKAAALPSAPKPKPRPSPEIEAREQVARLEAALQGLPAEPFGEVPAAPLLEQVRALKVSALLLAIPEVETLAESAERELKAAAEEKALRPPRREKALSALSALEVMLSVSAPASAPTEAAEPLPAADPETAEAFRRESEETVAALEAAVACVLSPAGADRSQALEDALRHSHNLKGAAAAVGEARIVEGASKLHAALARGLEPGDATGAAAAGEALAALRAVLRARTAPPPPPALAKAPEPKAAEPQAPAAVPDRTIRVSVGSLESVVRQIENLVAVRARQERRAKEIFGQAAAAQEVLVLCERALSELRMSGAQGPTAALDQGVQRLRGLQRSLSRLGQSTAREVEQVRLLSTVAREDLRDLRMVPASSALDPLRRTAREVAGRLKKEVELAVFGGDVRLDRRILEELKDPLQHMVRNSMDHGLESSDERRAAGKRQVGSLRVGVERRGHRIAVIVQDDGRGMDPDRIKASAVQKGQLSAKEAAELSDDEAYRLIFKAGVSTAAQVTAISGRGIGMDVVQSTVNRLGGAVEIRTGLGQGTRFTLDLPLTLAATLAVIVRSSGEVAAVPHEAVERIVRLRSKDLGTVAGRASVRVDSAQVPFVVLSQVLGLGQGRLTLDGNKAQPALLMSAGGSRAVMAVEEVVGQQEVIIQSLGRQVSAAHLAGAALLDDGRVAAVLNASELLRLAQPTTRARSGAAAQRSRVLVADDSLTTRSAMKAILEIAGYEVVPAADGEEALRLLRQARCQLVVTDVQMPRMDGLALTRQIKADPLLAKTPVVVVTSLDGPSDRAAGLEAGADGYLVKRDIERGKLLDLVRQLLPEP